MRKLPNIHPGEIIEEEFLKPYKITAYRLAKETHMPVTRISEILKKRRRITTDTALRLSKFFKNSPEFWLGIQMEYDLRQEIEYKKEELNTIQDISSLHLAS